MTTQKCSVPIKGERPPECWYEAVSQEDDSLYRQLLSHEAISSMAHPVGDKALIGDELVSEEVALQKIAEVCLNAQKPVIFSPARIVLWNWEEGAAAKAKLLRKIAEAIGAEILPIMDIRPDYPMMRTGVEINPYHGDLVIEHNKYDVAVFMGVDCPYADVALKIIRDGTACYTVALCGHIGHVDAMVTLQSAGMPKLERLLEIINEMKEKKSTTL